MRSIAERRRSRKAQILVFWWQVRERGATDAPLPRKGILPMKRRYQSSVKNTSKPKRVITQRMGPAPKPLADRFWGLVNKTDGCWEWQGVKNRYGYGRFYPAGNKAVAAHRFSWVLSHGDLPKFQQGKDAMCILHKCDNPCCVRPDHLFLGTHKDNAQDCVSKGRKYIQRGHHINVGETNACSKLTTHQVKEIISLRGVLTQTAIGKIYGVSHTTVWKIFNKVKWKHINV